MVDVEKQLQKVSIWNFVIERNVKYYWELNLNDILDNPGKVHEKVFWNIDNTDKNVACSTSCLYQELYFQLYHRLSLIRELSIGNNF